MKARIWSEPGPVLQLCLQIEIVCTSRLGWKSVMSMLMSFLLLLISPFCNPGRMHLDVAKAYPGLEDSQACSCLLSWAHTSGCVLVEAPTPRKKFLIFADQRDQQVANMVLQLTTQKDESIALKQRIQRFEAQAVSVQADAAASRRLAEKERSSRTDVELQLAIARRAFLAQATALSPSSSCIFLTAISSLHQQVLPAVWTPFFGLLFLQCDA